MAHHGVAATENPLSGLWKPNRVENLYYGPDCVQKHLLSSLPNESSKAFIITGSSLAQKTPLIKSVEQLLGSKHAGTFSSIKQHNPVAQMDEGVALVQKDPSVDTVISIGGGSPIDAAKVVSYRANEKNGKYLYHIAIPTTLSAGECTMAGGFTKEDGTKAGVFSPEIAPKTVFYDPVFGKHTPPKLMLGTGLRALDHSMELMYHPTATEVPCKRMALTAAADLFTYLPKYQKDPQDEDAITHLLLACFASCGFLGLNFAPMGLSHSLGYALGSPYMIPHGETSCLTLGHVVKLKAETDSAAASNIARMMPSIGKARTGDDKADALTVADAILSLVKNLGFIQKLGEYGVGEDQVQIITERATNSKKGDKLYDAVEPLVKGLY
ncbi:Dehydroquinate synthase-like protein [Viridothelium virens]|uniref:Dehydroquinate synthase-like protein n=1 Tax=Viridothelium virens TaxID=1048519 RepID=A0A6A6HCG2_VIRVR|nr:Dehydroquinate synthase-like protein [Viridothelium virens]